MPHLVRHLPRLVLLVLCLVLAVPAVAGSQLFAGLTMPMGDLSDGADMGYHGGVSMHFPIVPLTFSAGPTVIYSRMPGPGDDTSVSYLELLATATLSIPAGPMLHGGLGYALPSVKFNGIDLKPDNEAVIVIGTGTKLALLEVKALWHHVGDSNFVTISAGLGF